MVTALLITGLTACTSSAEQVVARASTKAEIERLIQQYEEKGEYRFAWLAADRMVQLFPDDPKGYEKKVDLQIRILQKEYDSFSAAIAKDIEKVVDTGAYRSMIAEKLEAASLGVTIPFASDYKSASEINAVGNTGSNLQATVWLQGTTPQSGLFASQGDWTYFANLNANLALYKMRSDGSGKQKIDDDGACQINVVGDWVYFSNIADKQALYKIRTDGSNKTKLVSQRCEGICVIGEWIVYVNADEGGALYRIRNDGTQQSKIADDGCHPFSDGQRLYYSTKDERNLFQTPIDGAGRQTLLSNLWHVGTFFEDGWLYYLTDNKGLVISKMRPDGSEKTQVFYYDGKINSFIVQGNHLIISFRSKANAEGIMVYSMDTMEKTLQNDDFPSDIWVVAKGNIFLTNYNDNLALYRFNWDNRLIEKVQ